MTSAAEDTTLLSRHRPLVAGVLGLMTFIAFESFAVTTALLVVAAHLAAEQWYSLAFTATLTTGIVGMTIGGNWADRRGVVVPLAVGGAAFLVGIMLCVAAPTMDGFIAGRLLQGIGGGIDSVVIYVVIAQLIPEGLRSRMFGLLAGGVAAALGRRTVALRVLVELVGWRAFFALVLVGSAMSLLVLLVIVRRALLVRADPPAFGRRGVWAIVASLAVLGAARRRAAADAGPSRLDSGRCLRCRGDRGPVAAPRDVARPRGIPRLVGMRGLLGGAVAAVDIYLPSTCSTSAGSRPPTRGSRWRSVHSAGRRAHGCRAVGAPRPPSRRRCASRCCSYWGVRWVHSRWSVSTSRSPSRSQDAS